MKLKIAQVIGLNTDQKAAQVISSVRADDNAFMAVLELTSDDAFTKGRQLLSELEDFYFESEGGTGEKLNATFKRGGEKLGESEFSLGLVANAGKALYLIGKGQVEVYLKRGDKLSSLLSVGGSSELISGFLQEEDKLLLATKSLVSFLGTELEKSLNLAIDTFEEEVESKIGSSNLDNQGLAGLVVEVSPSAEGKDVEIAPLPPTATDQKFDQQIDQASRGVLIQAILSRALNFVSRIRRFFPRSGRDRLILGGILIVIIVLGAGYKYKLNRDQERRLQFNQVLQEAKDNFNAAKSLALLNPTEAKNKLDLAKDKVNSSLALKPKDSEAENLKKQIEEDSAAILQQSNISDFPVFLDMDLVKKNFRAVNLSLSADKLLLLDPVVKTLVVIDLTKKSNQILAGEEQLGDASVASLNGALAFIYSKDKGVLKIDITNQKLAVVSKKDSEWGEIADIYGFAGNVYALDKGNPERAEGQIWKYLPTPDGYSGKREYLSKGVKVDFKEAVRMQIESSVYVLKSTGEILRFTRGDKDNFSLEGLPGAVKEPKSLFISSETDNLYLLDSGNKRLLILTKTGSFKGEIKGDKFGEASDLAVDEKNKKIYLLEGGKIYTADLK